MIALNESAFKARQIELLNNLGFIWNPGIKTAFLDITSDITIRKLGNTFGLFLISPFLIIALAFVIDG